MADVVRFGNDAELDVTEKSEQFLIKIKIIFLINDSFVGCCCCCIQFNLSNNNLIQRSVIQVNIHFYKNEIV